MSPSDIKAVTEALEDNEATARQMYLETHASYANYPATHRKRAGADKTLADAIAARAAFSRILNAAEAAKEAK